MKFSNIKIGSRLFITFGLIVFFFGDGVDPGAERPCEPSIQPG